MKNVTIKLKKAVDKGMTCFSSGSPLNTCSLTLTLVLAVFAGQFSLLANVSYTRKENNAGCISVNELFERVNHSEEIDQKNKELLKELLNRYVQDIEEFEAFKDPNSEGYRALITKISPIVHARCDKDLEKVEGGAYLKSFLEFYRPNSEKYQSLGKDNRDFIDMLYDCFPL